MSALFCAWLQINSLSSRFESQYGVPKVLGAVDISHVAITKAPVGKSSAQYANPMQYHSIHLLAVADSCSKFTYVNVGRPGSMSDVKVM